MSNEINWSAPPAGPDGSLLQVDFRYAVFKVDNVDTTTLSVRIKLAIVFYWTDSRLVGWNGSLPPLLWGPDIMFTNTQEMSTEQPQFELTDSQGRLKRSRLFFGTINNAMDLHTFPFDLDSIDLNFDSVSHWLSLDESAKGSLPFSKSYSLRPVSKPMEGQFIGIYWSGDIHEWQLLGVSYQFKELPPTPQGSERTTLALSFHVARRGGFYVWKVIVPVTLLGVLCFSTFNFPVQDVGNRHSAVATYFLSAMSMLYVVGQYLPRTDYLTQLDKATAVTTALNALIGILVRPVAWVSNRDYDLAKRADKVIELLLILFYTVGMLYFLLPSYFKQRKTIFQLSEAHRPIQVHGTTMLETVAEGMTYMSLKLLTGKAVQKTSSFFVRSPTID